MAIYDRSKHLFIFLTVWSKYNIYSGTAMESKSRMLQLYTSGQFQCDYNFHLWLLKMARQLDLYEYETKIEDEARLVRSLLALTDHSSRQSQQDCDDAELVSLTLQIKDCINKINTAHIHSLLQECQDLKWESYSAKVAKLLAGRPAYESIAQRIQKTVHSDQLRTDSLLFTALFSCINCQLISNYLHIYSTMVDIFLKYLNGNAAHIDTIYEASTFTNLLQLPKITNFVFTLYLALKLCLRFCEIIKILEGKNNLSLKFTAIKKEIEKIIRKQPGWRMNQETDDVWSIIPHFKLMLKSKEPLDKSRICRWCFTLMAAGKHEHAFCRLVIDNRTKFILQ